MPIPPSRTFQVKNNPTLTALQYDKAPNKIPAEYFDYANVFLTNLAIALSGNIGINKYTI